MIDLDDIFAEPPEPAVVGSADEAVLDSEDEVVLAQINDREHRPEAIARGQAWIASQRWTEQTVGGVRIIALAGAPLEPLHNFPADGWPPGELRPLLWRGDEQNPSHSKPAGAMKPGPSTANTCRPSGRERGL